MMHFTFAVLVATLAARDVIAKPIARSPYVVKETHFVPTEWSRQGRSHGGKTIQLQIGLKQGRFDELDRHLYEGKLQKVASLIVASQMLTLHSLGPRFCTLWAAP
jgi:hypothetical protein